MATVWASRRGMDRGRLQTKGWGLGFSIRGENKNQNAFQKRLMESRFWVRTERKKKGAELEFQFAEREGVVACANLRTTGTEGGCQGRAVTLSEPPGWRRWKSWEEAAVLTLLQRHFGKAEVVVLRLRREAELARAAE